DLGIHGNLRIVQREISELAIGADRLVDSFQTETYGCVFGSHRPRAFEGSLCVGGSPRSLADVGEAHGGIDRHVALFERNQAPVGHAGSVPALGALLDT